MKSRRSGAGVWLSLIVGGFSIGLAHASGDWAPFQLKLGIPFSEGRIVDAYGTSPQYILIQDIHRHPEAQNHIAAMILCSRKNLGAKEVFVEGSWARPGRSEDYIGLEDADIYKANVAAYEQVSRLQNDALRELETAHLLGRAVDRDMELSWEQVKRLIQLRLKPAEYAEYMQHPYRSALKESSLSQAVEAAELFYEIANQRSEIFLRKAKKWHRSGAQVLVVGGFHTAAMAAALKQEGISYVVLSPQVTQGGYEQLYAQGMRETVNALKLH